MLGEDQIGSQQDDTKLQHRANQKQVTSDKDTQGSQTRVDACILLRIQCEWDKKREKKCNVI